MTTDKYHAHDKEIVNEKSFLKHACPCVEASKIIATTWGMTTQSGP